MLGNLCLEAGADDVGFVGVDDPAVAPQRADIDWLMPGTQALINFFCRMNQENIRTPARSISNLEFHLQTDETNIVAQKIVLRLEALKIRASIAGAAGFPKGRRDPGVARTTNLASNARTLAQDFLSFVWRMLGVLQ